MLSVLRMISTQALRIWMTIAHALNFVMMRVMLAVVYVLVIAPIGIVRRVFGNDPLMRALDPQTHTYWTARSADESTMNDPF